MVVVIGRVSGVATVLGYARVCGAKEEGGAGEDSKTPVCTQKQTAQPLPSLVQDTTAPGLHRQDCSWQTPATTVVAGRIVSVVKEAVVAATVVPAVAIVLEGAQKQALHPRSSTIHCSTASGLHRQLISAGQIVEMIGGRVSATVFGTVVAGMVVVVSSQTHVWQF